MAFVEMMIPHHLGAVVMSRDALKKAEHPEIKTLSNQITREQDAEIKTIGSWKTAWAKQVTWEIDEIMTKSELLRSEMFALCPDFTNRNKSSWELFTDDDGTFSVHGAFIVFSHYISDKLKAKQTDGMDEVFAYIETKLGGDKEIDEAATTCFLENIMNRVPNSIDPKIFVSLLGPQSREFCRGWDEWCGTQTEGL